MLASSNPFMDGRGPSYTRFVNVFDGLMLRFERDEWIADEWEEAWPTSVHLYATNAHDPRYTSNTINGDSPPDLFAITIARASDEEAFFEDFTHAERKMYAHERVYGRDDNRPPDYDPERAAAFDKVDLAFDQASDKERSARAMKYLHATHVAQVELWHHVAVALVDVLGGNECKSYADGRPRGAWSFSLLERAAQERVAYLFTERAARMPARFNKRGRIRKVPERRLPFDAYAFGHTLEFWVRHVRCDLRDLGIIKRMRPEVVGGDHWPRLDTSSLYWQRLALLRDIMEDNRTRKRFA